MNTFKNAIQRMVILSDNSWEELESICSVQTLKKTDFLLRQGGVCNGFYYISEGLVRIFYYKHDKDISEWFAFEDSFCFSIISYFQKTPSSLAIQCIEDSEIITISRDGLNELRQKNFELAELAYKFLSSSLIASQHRMAAFQFETALQRYENLIKLNKNFVHRVPLQYIASYLGVSAETLSRIRSQVH